MHLRGESIHHAQVPVTCRKCHSSTAGNSKSKFCDQCGYRLRAKHKTKQQPKNQDYEPYQPTTQSLTSTLVPNPHEGGWFWGSNELPPLSVPRNCGVDRRDTSYAPPTYPLVKARTANGMLIDSPEENPRLRRASSFGAQPCLPALPLLATQDQLVGGENAVITAQKDVVVGQSGEPESRSILWGDVLMEAIAEFESRKIVLAVEIDSDEGCMCVLAQKLQIEEAARSKYVVASGTSQLRYKYNELEKKVRINKEKFKMVEHRLAALYGQRALEANPRGRSGPECDETPGRVEDQIHQASQNDHSELKELSESDPRKKTRKRKQKKKKKSTDGTHPNAPEARRTEPLEAAATLIQKQFRVLRARRLFAEMVKRAFRRVFDADSKRYFYYNERTNQSRWELPPTIARANSIVAQRRLCRAPSARSIHAAASRIQALYRRRAARRALRQLLTRVYEKVYDAESGSYYYYCSTTKTSTWDKPRLLRGEDLPTRPSESATAPLACLDGSVHDAAAVKIQTIFRNRATRQFMRDLATGSIEKHFDSDAQAWYYFNTRTQQSFWEQPRHATISAAMRPR